MHSELLLLKISPNPALQNIYIKYRGRFLRRLKKHAIPHEEAIALYQDAFIALREHCIEGAFTNSKITLGSSVLAIGDILLRERQLIPDDIAWSPKKPFDTIPVFQAPKITVSQRVLGKHFKTLGLRCQKMLSLFYYRKLTIPEIIQILGHETELIVRRQKTRCLLSLKEATHSPSYEERELLLDHYMHQTLSEKQQARFNTLLEQEESFKEDLNFLLDLQAITGSIERKDFKTTMVTFERHIAATGKDNALVFGIKRWAIPVLLLIALSAVVWFYFG